MLYGSFLILKLYGSFLIFLRNLHKFVRYVTSSFCLYLIKLFYTWHHKSEKFFVSVENITSRVSCHFGYKNRQGIGKQNHQPDKLMITSAATRARHGKEGWKSSTL